jgi:lipopolysaccharide transport system permease protein
MPINAPVSAKAANLKLITPDEDILTYLNSLASYKELLWFLVLKEFLVKYKQTYFGLLWVLIKPIVTSGLVFVIFQRLGEGFGANEHYLLFVFVGVSVWQFFSGVGNEGSLSLLSNTNLVTRSYFPRALLPIAKAIAGIFDLAVMLSLAIILAFLEKGNFFLDLQLFLLLPAVALAFISSIAVALIGAALSVRYRDLQYTFPFVFQIGFFATPIIFAFDFLPESYRWIFLLNPIVIPIEIARIAFGFKASFSTIELGIGLTLIFGLLSLGLLFSARSEKEIADLI